MFDAYVNIGSLRAKAQTLREHYPRAKFIITTSEPGASVGNTLDILDGMSDCAVAVLRSDAADKWKVVCEHIKCAPPVCSFPDIADIGQRRLLDANVEASPVMAAKDPKRDRSPWVVEPRQGFSSEQLSQDAHRQEVAMIASQRRLNVAIALIGLDSAALSLETPSPCPIAQIPRAQRTKCLSHRVFRSFSVVVRLPKNR